MNGIWPGYVIASATSWFPFQLQTQSASPAYCYGTVSEGGGGLNLEGVLLFGVIKRMITKVGWGGGWLDRLTITVLIPALTASIKFGR